MDNVSPDFKDASFKERNLTNNHDVGILSIQFQFHAYLPNSAWYMEIGEYKSSVLID